MARWPLPQMVGVSAAVLVVALSLFAATLVNEHRIGQPNQSVQAGTGLLPKSADLMSLMQGTKIHLELNSLKDADVHQNGKEDSQLAKGAKDVRNYDKTTHGAKDEVKPSDIALAITSADSVSSFAKMWQAQRVASGLEAQHAMATTLVVIFAFVMLAIFFATAPYWVSSVIRKTGSDPQSEQSGSENDASASNPVRPSVMDGAPVPVPVPETGGSELPAPRNMVKPTALCPTLVMPTSEALLGIQMYELAQLGEEGELNIVGISGKPLLRAKIKKMGDQRTLEITMPEPNSIPRATIQPASENASYGLHAGSRALEIRGMRGAFYGILEMRGSGACHVVRNGQTELSIDGDAESLRLSLKSSVGLQLASVRCSTELFNDVDHVEIRVEPGVDTVLVLSVVLAVLLLSPYLPPTA